MGEGKPGPSDERVERALKLRARGWEWNVIAAHVGYKNARCAQASCSRHKHAALRRIDAKLAALPF